MRCHKYVTRSSSCVEEPTRRHVFESLIGIEEKIGDRDGPVWGNRWGPNVPQTRQKQASPRIDVRGTSGETSFRTVPHLWTRSNEGAR